jgi:hypothetical protein
MMHGAARLDFFNTVLLGVISRSHDEWNKVRNNPMDFADNEQFLRTRESCSTPKFQFVAGPRKPDAGEKWFRFLQDVMTCLSSGLPLRDDLCRIHGRQSEDVQQTFFLFTSTSARLIMKPDTARSLNEYVLKFFAQAWLQKEIRLQGYAVRCVGESAAAHQCEFSGDLTAKIVPKMANSALSVDAMMGFFMRFQMPLRVKVLGICMCGGAARTRHCDRRA